MPITVAQRIADFLTAIGVETMFSQSLPTALVLAAEDAGIRQITYRTENAAGAMADGYARVSNRMGVVCAQKGPAATLLVPPMAEAITVGIPMLALVQEVPRDQTDKNAFQEFDHTALFASCTKWTRTVIDGARIDDFLRQAVVNATTGRAGPVALMLPADVLLESHDYAPLPDMGELGQFPLDRVTADPVRLEEAALAIARAERPLIIAGGGVHISGAVSELARLRDLAAIPVGTTMMGKGACDEAHPLGLGLVGNAMGKRSIGAGTVEYVRSSDLVVLVGNRTNQNGTDGWTLISDSAQVIHIDVDGAEVERNYPGLRLVGDARATLSALADMLALLDLSKQQKQRGAREALIARARGASEAARQKLRRSRNLPIRPERVLDEVVRVLPSGANIVADASYSSVWINTQLEAGAGSGRFLTPRGLAGLGWGYPMALGAQLASSDTLTICIAGDGGFGHVWSELETAVREDIPVVLIVLNNAVLGYQKDAEEVKFGRYTGACHFNAVDHTAIAKAVGCKAWRVSDPEELSGVLRQAVEAKAPVLIDVISDPDAFPPLSMFDGLDRPISSGVLEDA